MLAHCVVWHFFELHGYKTIIIGVLLVVVWNYLEPKIRAFKKSRELASLPAIKIGMPSS